MNIEHKCRDYATPSYEFVSAHVPSIVGLYIFYG